MDGWVDGWMDGCEEDLQLFFIFYSTVKRIYFF